MKSNITIIILIIFIGIYAIDKFQSFGNENVSEDKLYDKIHENDVRYHKRIDSLNTRDSVINLQLVIQKNEILQLKKSSQQKRIEINKLAYKNDSIDKELILPIP